MNMSSRVRSTSSGRGDLKKIASLRSQWHQSTRNDDLGGENWKQARYLGQVFDREVPGSETGTLRAQTESARIIKEATIFSSKW